MISITKEEMLELVYDAQKTPLGFERLERLMVTLKHAKLEELGSALCYYRYLYMLSSRIKPLLSVELGTLVGISSACIAEGFPNGRVITINNQNQLREEYKRNNVEYWIQDSMAPLRKPLKDVNLLFIDTVHTEERPKNEYDYWLKYMAEDGVILFDDITGSGEMRRFWASFKPIKSLKFDLPIHETGFGVVILEKEKMNE